MSVGWGDAVSCKRCGHPPTFHGVSFCAVLTGHGEPTTRRVCDCPGWQHQGDQS